MEKVKALLQADGCPGLRFAGDMDKKLVGASKSQKKRQSASQFPSSSSSLCAVRHEGCGGVRLDPHTEYREGGRGEEASGGLTSC